MAVAGGAVWLAVGLLDRMQRDSTADDQVWRENTAPFQGAIGHIRQQTFADHSRFVSVQEDTDAQGARIFFVDYGNGQLCQQYFDPRIWQ